MNFRKVKGETIMHTSNFKARCLGPRLAALALIACAGSTAAENIPYGAQLRADLITFNQVPAVYAGSSGFFQATINSDNTITFTLSYANMSSPVTQAHIHFGAGLTNGGIMVFLCGGAAQPCPASGTVTGTLTAADVSTLPTSNSDSVIPQGIQPGAFAAMLAAIRSGNSYVNVHTTTFPSGEIRGQVQIR
jgi:CHRD domain